MTRPVIVSVALSIGLAIVVYVLSVGPAIKLAHRSVVSHSFIAMTYSPLEWSAHHCRPLDLFLQWYTDKWEPSFASPSLSEQQFLAVPAGVPQPVVSAAGIPNAPMPTPHGLRSANGALNAGQ